MVLVDLTGNRAVHSRIARFEAVEDEDREKGPRVTPRSNTDANGGRLEE